MRGQAATNKPQADRIEAFLPSRAARTAARSGRAACCGGSTLSHACKPSAPTSTCLRSLLLSPDACCRPQAPLAGPDSTACRSEKVRTDCLASASCCGALGSYINPVRDLVCTQSLHAFSRTDRRDACRHHAPRSVLISIRLAARLQRSSGKAAEADLGPPRAAAAARQR